MPAPCGEYTTAGRMRINRKPLLSDAFIRNRSASSFALAYEDDGNDSGSGFALLPSSLSLDLPRTEALEMWIKHAFFGIRGTSTDAAP